MMVDSPVKRWMAPALRWGMHGVRTARHGDRTAVTSTTAAAFADDPAWTFLFGDDYDRLAPLFAGRSST